MINLLQIESTEAELSCGCNVSWLAEEQILGGIAEKDPAVRGDTARIVLPQGWRTAFTTFLFNRLEFNGVKSHRVGRDQENSRLIYKILHLCERATMPDLSHAIHDMQHSL